MITIEDQICEQEFKRQEKATQLNKKRIEAAFSGNALNFYELTNKTGFPVESQFQELYSQGEIEYLKQQNELKNQMLEVELQSELSFLGEVKRIGLNVEDIFSDRKIKQRLIKDYKGYERLNFKDQNIREGEKGMPLNGCSDARIGEVFKGIYYSSLKKLKQF